MTEPIEVRGHLCDGLRKHFETAKYSCIPSLNERGQIEGCDDTNKYPIAFCPWCGIELPKIAPREVEEDNE